MQSQTGKVILFMGAGKPLQEREFSLPDELQPGAILVKMSVATVCGSDMHSWRGRRAFAIPATLGHEGVGTIAQLGPGVEGDSAGKPLRLGDRMTWVMYANCGVCRLCTINALPQKCLNLFKYGHVQSDIPPYFTGTFGEYVYIRPGTAVFKVPNDLADEEASPLMCAAATVIGGFDRIDLAPGENVVIQGAGMLGLYASALAKEQGAKKVIVIDILNERLQLAREFGADEMINAQQCKNAELIDAVKDMTDGWGADVVVEVAGLAQVIPLGVKMLRLGGRYLLAGSIYPDDEFTLASHDVITKCLTITGMHNYYAKHLALALDLVGRSREQYPYKRLTGPKFPLSVAGVTAALESLEKRESIRPIVTP